MTRATRLLIAPLTLLAVWVHTSAASSDLVVSLSDWRRAELLANSHEHTSLIAGDDWVTIDPIAMVQFRYTASEQDQLDGMENLTQGFQTVRTRVGFKGTLKDHDLEAFVWTGYSGGGALLLDAWANWSPEGNLSIRVGQMKLPVWHEWIVSETKEAFVERSLLEARFSPLYGQGVSATWRDDTLSVTAMFSDGLRGWNRVPLGNQTALTARAELKFMGEWAQRADFDSFPDEEPFAVLGFAAHTQDGGLIGAVGGPNIYANDTRITQLTADFQLGLGGTAFFAAIISNAEQRPGGTEYHQLGVLLQAQTFISDDTEIFARYEWGDLDGEAAAFAVANPGATTEEELQLLTVGISKFLVGHSLKVTADLGVSFTEVSGSWNGAGRGWFGDDNGASNQTVFRLQTQVIF